MSAEFELQPNADRVRRSIDELAEMVNADKPGWTRRPFTPWYKQSREWLMQRMLDAGLSVRIDAGSNLIGVLPGTVPGLKPIAVGSHTDTVTGGGRFDGIIGVVAGLELAKRLQETGTKLCHPLEIIDFTAEEPSEFGISTIGSRAMVGNLSEEMLEQTDQAGLKLRDGIRMMGGDPDRIADTVRKPGEISLYLELHIEQGPVLELTERQLGVVTGIVGIHRYRVVVEGKPNHAGTTPMNMRFDALTAASELILELESLCRGVYSDPVVGTVGKLFNEPNGANVIPGKVMFELEVRSLDTALLDSIMARYAEFAAHVASYRSVGISLEKLSQSMPIRVDDNVQLLVEQACLETGTAIRLPSGAGHDANQMAAIGPVGMLFVPSRDGRSHCPEEWTDPDAVARGVEALARAVYKYDQLAK